jgi:hypothetical protein
MYRICHPRCIFTPRNVSENDPLAARLDIEVLEHLFVKYEYCLKKNSNIMKYTTFCGTDYAVCVIGCSEYVYWLTNCMKYGLWVVVVFVSCIQDGCVGLRPLACCDRGFESHWRHGCLTVVCVVR